MNRQRFLAATTAALVAAPSLVRAASKKVYLVTQRGRTDVERGFLEALGSGFDVVDRDLEFDLGRVPALIEEIKRERPALVYSYGTSITAALAGPYDAPSRIGEVPLVFSLVTDPFGSRIVRDWAHPERNVTGVSHVPSNAELLQRMRDIHGFAKIGVVYSGADVGTKLAVTALDAFSQANPQRFGVVQRAFGDQPSASQVAELVKAVKNDGAEWLLFVPDSWLAKHAGPAIAAANEARLPTFTSTEAFLQAGAFGGYYAPYADVGRLAGQKAREILRGTPVRSVPTERAPRFVFAYSRRCSRILGLSPHCSGLTEYAG